MTPPATVHPFLPERIHAFGSICFEVYGRPPTSVRLGQQPEACATWLDACAASSAWIVTAWNPLGRVQGTDWNEQANSQLRADIDQQGLRRLPARGFNATGDRFEEGFCVFDASEAQADGWLVRFRQAAVVRLRRGHAPERIWHPLYRADGAHCPP